MKTLKHYIDILGVFLLNGGALLFSSPESLELVKSLLQIAVLAATLIYTCIRIFKMKKKTIKDED